MSPICGVCNDVCLNEASDPCIKCKGSCEKSFHVRCVKDDIDAKRTRSQWKCRDCRSSSTQGSGNSSTTTTALTKDFLVRVIEEFKAQVFGEMKSFRDEVTSLSTSVQFLSDKMDTSNTLMEEIKKELTALKKENEDLRATTTSLTSEVCSLRERVRSLEQYTRNCNIEISGIPVTAKEVVADIVHDVGAALGMEVQDSQVAAAHRIPSYNRERTPSIVVQFQSRVTRDSWISRFREVKTLTANQVNSAFNKNQKVYVNEHLAPENKLFLSKLKQKCKDLGYSYVWCRDGKFFVRKAQGVPCKRIDSYEDMLKLQ